MLEFTYPVNTNMVSAEIAANTTTSKNANFASELDAPIWAVISFDRVESNSLSYTDALAKLKELDAAGVNGLCIVTNDAAARTVKPSKL